MKAIILGSPNSWLEAQRTKHHPRSYRQLVRLVMSLAAENGYDVNSHGQKWSAEK